MYIEKIAQYAIKGFGVADDEVLNQFLKPNIPCKKGFNNFWNRTH